MIKRKSFFDKENNEFQLLKSEKDDILSLVLPGAGYHTDLPLFYFISQLLAEKYGHVLQVKHSTASLDNAEKMFNQQVEKGNYSEFIIVGKSAGTTKAGRLLKRNEHLKSAKIIWLTPLLGNQNLYETLLKTENKSLLIIGDQDRHYIKEKISELKTKNNFSVHVMNNATHSLEFVDKGNVNESLKILREIVKIVEKFIKE